MTNEIILIETKYTCLLNLDREKSQSSADFLGVIANAIGRILPLHPVPLLAIVDGYIYQA